jgi:magnesium and cobalt transporter
LDEGSDSSIWQRLAKIFHGKQIDAVEQAIRDASEEGQLDKEEGTMLLSILSLDEMQVQDIMTPRTDIACAPEEASIRSVSELSIESGHSRIPIFSGNRDNIIGIVHVKDLLQHLLDPEQHAKPVTAIMRDPFFVPETKNVYDVLQEFRTRKQHLAVILDEYGGTAGLVSIEDVIELIVGDIEDEHDTPREEEIALQADGSYLISGRTDLEDLAETLKIELESEEVDTLGGYLTHLAGRVPVEGEQFPIGTHMFTVVQADAKQIHSIRLSEALPEAGQSVEEHAAASEDTVRAASLTE